MLEESIARSFYLIVLASVVLALIQPIDGWLLSQVGLNESYRIRHLSTHFSRVFLCIAVESNTFPTLIEAEWPASYMPIGTRIYPHHTMHTKGEHNDCGRIQQAWWTHVDGLSRLWVMDMGWKDDKMFCPPKLLVFDLIRNDAEVLHIDCSKYINPDDANKLVVRMGPKVSHCRTEKFIYFILAQRPYILAYDILKQNWHRRKLMAKKFKSVKETFPIKPHDMTFGKYNELLISDHDGYLYSSINQLYANQTSNEIKAIEQNEYIELDLLGNLLGPSRGMLTDTMGALFYIVSKYGAVVRCEYKKNLTTENNEIIYMTSKNLQQIFLGIENSVWLLTDRQLKPNDHCFPG